VSNRNELKGEGLFETPTASAQKSPATVHCPPPEVKDYFEIHKFIVKFLF